jgi:hypothetical protein
VDAAPFKPKAFSDFTNTMLENFFGEQTTVTKLRNIKTGEERLI